MTPPAAGFLAADETAIEEDWFGEGSAFDSGESLASALMALVGTRAVPPPVSRPEPPPASAVAPRQAPPDRPAAPAPPPGEFQVAAMPSFRRDESTQQSAARASAAGWRPAARPASAPRNGWSIRQGVHILRVTEQTLVSLREQAAECTWELAAAAYRDADV
jgi:hypothetical protein